MTRTKFKVELFLSVPSEGETDERDIRWFVEDTIGRAISELRGEDEQPKLEGEVEALVWETIKS